MNEQNNRMFWTRILSVLSLTPTLPAPESRQQQQTNSAQLLHKNYESPTVQSMELLEIGLPGHILGNVLNYLHLEEVTYLVRAGDSFFAQLNNSGALMCRHQEELCREFRRLVALEGEDNQNKAEKMLQKYPDLASKLITGQIIKFRDAAGRVFETPMSAYGYAYWSGDTFMRRMMERYMNEDAKAKGLEECEYIENEGITFVLKAGFGELEIVEKITGSKHFDFQFLIQAYKAWVAEATPLINARNWDDALWAKADALWLDIGKEWAKVPTHVVQELCSNRPFYPLPDFKQENLNRTVKFYNWINDSAESISTESGFHSGLGVVFSMYKGPAVGARMRRYARRGGNNGGPDLDLAAITTLSHLRTELDLRDTLEDLRQGFGAQLNC